MRNRYLLRRGDAFYFRMAVPADLQQHFRQREIVKALGTTDKRVAVPAALAIASRVLQQFHEVRCSMTKANRVELMVLFDWRPDGSKTIKFDDVQPGDVETVQKLAREFAADTLPPAAPAPAPKKDATPTLSEAVKQFLAREAKGDKVAMLRKHESVLPVFVELVGDVRLSELKQRQLNQFFDDLCRLPKTWHLIRRREKLTVRQIIEREWPGVELVGLKSFKGTWRPSVSRFLSWARSTFHDDGFPVGLTLGEATYSGDRKSDEHKQRALTLDELKRLFEGPEQAAFAADPAEHHKYWLPLLCAYSGSRISEVAQLNPQTDIKQDVGGVWYFELSEESEGADGLRKSIKTGVTRRVPIHQQLIDLGFLSYVERVKATGSKLIFPEWSVIESGKLRQPGRWLAKHLRTIGLYGVENEAGRALRGAHAFRHTFLSHGYAQSLDLERFTHKVPAHQSSVVAGYIDATIARTMAADKELIDRLDYGLSIPAPAMPL